MRTTFCLLAFLCISVSSCHDGSSDAAKSDTSVVAAADSKEATLPINDSTAISDCLRGFYGWYARNEDSLRAIDFVDGKGRHLVLDRKRLDEYMAKLRSSGFVSDELIGNETRFYEACEAVWKRERKDEVPSGLSADRFHCAQDYLAPYESGVVASVVTGERAKATLTIKGEMGESKELSYDMVRESGSWRIARLGCDSGVPY